MALVHGAKADYVTPIGETVMDALPEEAGKRGEVEEVLRRYGRGV